MDPIKVEKQTHEIIDRYIKELDHYTIEQLLQKPSENEWSIAQVYIHLWMSAKGFFFKKAEQCLSKENTQSGKSKNFVGRLVFLFGKMPTVKIKMPESVAVQPRQPESKEQLIAKLNEVKQLVTTYVRRIPQSDPDLKVKHPFLGYLNTTEWIKLCSIHFEHHRSQVKRIKKHFGW